MSSFRDFADAVLDLVSRGNTALLEHGPRDLIFEQHHGMNASEHLLVWQFISAEVLDGFDDVEQLVLDPHELGSSSSLWYEQGFRLALDFKSLVRRFMAQMLQIILQQADAAVGHINRGKRMLSS